MEDSRVFRMRIVSLHTYTHTLNNNNSKKKKKKNRNPSLFCPFSSL